MAAEVFGEENNPLPRPSTSRPVSSSHQASTCAATAAVANPAAARPMPAAVVRPVRPASLKAPPRREVAPIPTAIGTNARPATMGAAPWACSSQYGSRAKQDIRVPVLSNVAMVAAANRELRSKRPSMTGRLAISSVGTSRRRLTQATENQTSGPASPTTGPPIEAMPAPMPSSSVAVRIDPATSSRTRRRWTVGGTKRTANPAPMAAMGRPAQKIACQPPRATRMPPSGGPARPANAWVITSTATERPVRPRGAYSAMSDRLPAVSTPPPTA